MKLALAASILLSLIFVADSACAQVSGGNSVSGFKLPVPVPNECLIGAANGRQWVSSSNCSGTGSPNSVTSASPNVEILPSPGIGTFTIRTFELINLERSNNYNVTVNDDTYNILTGPHTYTIPQAGTAGIFGGWSTCLLNDGTTGNSIINTTGSVFKGATNTNTMTLTPGAWACLVTDGNNYNVRTALTTNAANFIAGTIKDNLGLARDLVKDFGAVCDGTTDNVAAFTAATTWMATGPGQRLVTIPAGLACATSQTVTIGDGRAQSTTLTGAAAGTSIAVASCSGITDGDQVAIRRNDGTVFQSVTSSSCIGTTLTISGAYSGGAAGIGNAVFSGKASTYVGGGFVGYGAAVTGSPNPSASTIKYIGSNAPTTTLSGGAAANATSISVTSAANIALGTPLGVTLDDGSVWWTWARESPSGTTIPLGDWIPSIATAGNAVVIANNPVLKVAGPHYFTKLSGIFLDANSKAAIGLEMIGPTGAKVDGPRGITAMNYTAIGQYIHAAEFAVGQSGSVADNDFELNAQSPANANTIGCFYRGTAFMKAGVSRSRWHGGNCMAGGASLKAAAIVMEHIDNNTFDGKLYGHASGLGALGASLERRASPYQTGNFPTDNVILAPTFLDAVTNTTSNGQVTGLDYAPGLAVGDGGPIPSSDGVSGLVGVSDTGRQFGQFLTPNSYPGLAITRPSNTQVTIAQGSALDSTNTVVMYNNTCTVSVAATGLNGLDSSSVRAANTWYSIYIITKNGLNAQCLLHQTTPAVVGTPILITDYTHYAYVGRIKTDGSQNFLANHLLPPGQFLIDSDDTYTPGQSGFRPRSIQLLACGPGAGGGGGARQVSGTGVSGGAGGSGGGCRERSPIPYEIFPTSVAVTVGTGGGGGAAAAGDNTAGTAGSAASGPTFFGAAANTAIIYGGQGCASSGGQLNASSASGGGGIGLTSLNSLVACTAGVGSTAGVATTNGINGVVGSAGTTSGTSGLGGVGGAGTVAAAPVGSIVVGRYQCTGGGAGGAVTAAPASVNGGSGGYSGDSGNAQAVGGTVGTPIGAPGLTDSPMLVGAGGAGGYGNSAGNGGAGGAGATCSGGGGGGSALNGSTAGAGGAGGDGFGFVWELR